LVADRLPFDHTATNDLATLKTALASNHAEFRQILIVPSPDGSVGPGSYFAADGCVRYFYSPGWSALRSGFPGKEVSKGMGGDWYQTDICP